jgi:hypothetical protein
LAIIEHLKTSEIVTQHTTFLFRDEIPEDNAEHRYPHYWEYNGYMKIAFDETTRLGLNAIRYPLYQNKILAFTRERTIGAPWCNMSQYTPTFPQYLIVIEPGIWKPDAVDLLILTVQRFLKPEIFWIKIHRMIELEYIVYEPTQDEKVLIE